MSLAERTTFHLRVWTRFLAPVADVWALKTDVSVLSAEFRPWFLFLTSDVAAMGDALRSAQPGSFAAWLVPPGIRWPIELTEVQPGERFVDRSQNLIFSRFEHEHVFEPTSDGCRYIDSVTFTSTLPASKAVAIATQRLFVHRHRVAARRLPTDRKATAVTVLRAVVDAASSDEAA